MNRAEDESFVSSINKFTQTTTLSSKISTVLTSMMLKYTSILIHHLLKAGRHIFVAKNSSLVYENVNLITLNANDLMRSRYQCSEKSFITLLKTLYTLDNGEDMQSKFKIVRISNNLKTQANSIVVNYLFMGKVQC